MADGAQAVDCADDVDGAEAADGAEAVDCAAGAVGIGGIAAVKMNILASM